MSQDDDELDLQALQRQLDDAFATTRPRRGFEDELWQRVRAARPAQNRFRDALGAWGGSLRSVRVPAAAIALVVIVAVTVGVLIEAGHPGGGGASTASQNLNAGARAPQDYANAGFGKLPSPTFSTGKAAGNGVSQPQPVPATLQAIRYAWAGTTAVAATMAPVYRYQEPSPGAADQFASSLGTALRGRPAGFLGAYSAATYSLTVRGTVQTPPSSPAYFIFSLASMPALDTTGVGVDGATTNFLAAHNLVPQWPYSTTVTTSGEAMHVTYQRQFAIPDYGPASLVDSNGDRYGLEVDLTGNRPVVVQGMLPLTLDSANYSILWPAQAIAPALASAGPPGAPVAKLTSAELVYVLVPAGDHSFYEPAYLYTGTMQTTGPAATVRLLMPAVDPSQRTR